MIIEFILAACTGAFFISVGFSLNYFAEYKMRSQANKQQLSLGTQNIIMQKEATSQLRIQADRENLSYQHQEEILKLGLED